MEIVNDLEAKREHKFKIKKKLEEVKKSDVVSVPVSAQSSIENWNYIVDECDKLDKIDDVQMKIGNKEPSEYQKAVFKFIKNQVKAMESGGSVENLVIKAGAGCAKSTTLVHGLKFIPNQFKVGFFAFNKDIVEALKPKVTGNVRVQTFHSAGFGAHRYAFKGAVLDDKKMYSVFEKLSDGEFKYIGKEELGEMRNPFIKLCGMVKNSFSGIGNDELRFLVDRYNIEIGDSDEEQLFEMVRRGMSISNANPQIIDYNDMIYLPVKLGLQFFKLDVVFVDETQDLNRVQLLMLRKMVKDNGFVVCVGDENQAIYGFRGADTDAMDKMIKELKAKVLPLSRTYRCGKNIVKLANELVKELEADEKNIDGEVKNISYDEFYKLIKTGDMVLCRNNAPLIKPVFKLLSDGIRVCVKGRDIAEGLISLVRKLKVFDIKEFYVELEKWKVKEEEKAQRRKSQNMIQTIQDKCDCLMAISEDCNNVNEVVGKIEKIFSEGSSEIVFSSVHRAKGLESDRVFLLEPQLIPSRWTKSEWEIQQEKNILYVAITRAKEKLYLVGGNVNTKF